MHLGVSLDHAHSSCCLYIRVLMSCSCQMHVEVFPTHGYSIVQSRPPIVIALPLSRG